MAEITRPLVSIGISTYNRADGYLKDALGSALSQTYPNVEIIVSDNCSADETEAVVREFDDPRIRYFRQERNIGANNNFNFCLEQARGVYFLLLHDDDRIDPDFVEILMDAAGDATHFGLLRSGVRVIDDDGEVVSETPNEAGGLEAAAFVLAWFESRTSLYLCNTLYHTERLRGVGGFHSRRNLFQDVVATIRLVARYPRIDVSEARASFRRHGANAGAAAAVAAWCEDSLQVVEVMCEELPEESEVLRKKGLEYFTRTNYRYASDIESAVERTRTYWQVYGRLGYTLSPIRFFFPKLVRRPARRVARALKSGLRLT